MLFAQIDISHLIKRADYSEKIVKIERKILGQNKYIATNDFNKFLGVIFAERLKQAKSATKLGTFEQFAIKNEKKKSRNYNHLSYFLGKNIFSDNDFQIMFVYQPTFSTLDIKKNQ